MTWNENENKALNKKAKGVKGKHLEKMETEVSGKEERNHSLGKWLRKPK